MKINKADFTTHIIMNEFYGYEFFSFITKNFGTYKHRFIVLDSNFKHDSNNLIKTRRGIFRYLIIFYYLLKSKKVFFHGLFDPRIKLLMIMFIDKSRFFWVIWGGDLYAYMFYKFSFKEMVIKQIDKILFPKINNLVSFNKFDYELLLEKYPSDKNVNRKFYFAPYFVSYVFASSDFNKRVKSKQKTILVGNSASESNNHIDCFIKLFNEVDKSINRVVCPLTYGDSVYREQVIEFGRKLFGDRFDPITEYIDYKKHVKILEEVDEAIFFHDRQQALSTIIQLLALGKKVYIKNSVTTYRFLIQHGILVYNAIEDFNLNIYKDDSVSVAMNISNIKKMWSESNLVHLWREIL